MTDAPDEIDIPDDLGCEPLPGFFQIPFDHPDRELAINVYVAQLLSYPEGGMCQGWRDDFPLLLAAIKEGRVGAKSKPTAVK
jgi:hypothetical protein